MKFTFKLKYISKGGFITNQPITIDDSDKYLSPLYKKVIYLMTCMESNQTNTIFNFENQKYELIVNNEYSNTIPSVPQKHPWFRFIDCLKAFNYNKANEIYNKNKNSIDKYRYERAMGNSRLWEQVVNNLKNYNFGGADSIVQDYDCLQEFLDDNEYENKKADYIQKYFLSEYCYGNEAFKLDIYQSHVLGNLGKNLCVTARAGSGKTRIIVASILFLLEKHKAPWDSIYAFTFNKNAALEINQRINKVAVLNRNPSKYEKLDIAKTFHKLAHNWLNYRNEVLQGNNQKKFIKSIIEHLKETDETFGKEVYMFFRDDSFKVEEGQFNDPKDYYKYIRNSRFRTLKGNIVKSKGEKWIADFLFEHGIKYIYEKCFYISYIKSENIVVTDDTRKTDCLDFVKKGGNEIKPDFYLSDYNIVWEHWGINESETDNNKKNEFTKIYEKSWESYKEQLKWKRGFWKNWRKEYLSESDSKVKSIREINKLIETSINDMKCTDMKYARERFEEKLSTILRNENIPIIKRNENELIDDVWKNALDRFTTMTTSFISKFQQTYNNNRNKFLKDIEIYLSRSRVYSFYKLGYKVLEIYEYELNKYQKSKSFISFNDYTSDFNQIIINATNIIRQGEIDNEIMKIRYILVDEFQDFSPLFYELLNAIKSRNPHILFFCVGDDWQAVNRFMGADTRYFTSFTSYFDNAKRKELPFNYRSDRRIVNYSNNFMQRNEIWGSESKYMYDLKSSLIEFIPINRFRIEQKPDRKNYNLDKMFLEMFKNESNAVLKARYLKKCFDIVAENKNKNILILHRKNNLLFSTNLSTFKDRLFKLLEKFEVYNDSVECSYHVNITTIHKSKGQEADIVVLLEINQGVIPMYHPDNELNEIFGESKTTEIEDQIKLFYVAITRAKQKLFITYEEDKISDFIKDNVIENDDMPF